MASAMLAIAPSKGLAPSAEDVKIHECIQKLANCREEVGRLIAKKMDENPRFPEEFCQKYPQYQVMLIRILGRVGRGALAAELAFDHRDGMVALAKCSPDLQRKYLEGPLEMLLVDKDGNIVPGESLLVDVRNLTDDQARMIFDRGEVRDLAGQRAYLEGLKLKRAKSIGLDGKVVEQACSWQRKGAKNILVTKACELGKDDVRRMVEELGGEVKWKGKKK